MEWEYLIRLAVSALLGIAIGFERKLRFKEAGMRTHAIVSLGACLMMLLSIYAFDDFSDKGRVAAQIVSGVGFLGAGMIMFKGRSGIHGLTTAAGIWVTAGVGMAIGGGMYILGVGSAVLIIVIQCFLHLPFRVLKTTKYAQLKITFFNRDQESEKIRKLFGVTAFSKVKASKENDEVLLTATFTTDKHFDTLFIDKVLRENPNVISIERTEDD